jgi:hypothetical protein
MDSRQKALLKASFQRLLTVSDLGADLFAGRLYLLDPPLWHELGLGARPGQQALVRMLARLIDDLDRFEHLASTLEDVARRCASEGMDASQFDTIAETLFWTVQQVLGDAHQAPIAAAWREALALLVGRMKRAAAAQAIDPSMLRRIRHASCPELWHGPNQDPGLPLSSRLTPVG